MRKSVRMLMILVALGVVLGCASVGLAQGRPPIAGGYSKVDTNNPDVVAAAEFAVSAQKEKTGGPLSLVTIERAEWQVVQGRNYKLCLQVKPADEDDAGVEAQDVQVIVWEKLTKQGEKKQYQLTSWTEADCSK